MTMIARGDAPRVRPGGPPSPLPGVSNAAWVRFCAAMATAPLGAVSDSGCLGRYEMRPKRLGDLGLMENLKTIRRAGRQITVGSFKSPMTEAVFLRDSLAQYDAFYRSMKNYDEDLRCGRLTAPEGLSRSEALAVLHRAGPGALARWPERKFNNTAAAVARAAGLF